MQNERNVKILHTDFTDVEFFQIMSYRSHEFLLFRHALQGGNKML